MMNWEADERLQGVYLLLDAIAKVLVDLSPNPPKDVLGDSP